MPPISTSRYGTICSRWYSWTIGVPGACRKEITRISASAARAAGRAIQKFSRNLSFISQPCPLQAAIVVSEMKERLSPNMDPPMTEATQSVSEKPEVSATAAAIGTRSVIVPTEVPMAVETKQATTKSTATAYFAGIQESMK